MCMEQVQLPQRYHVYNIIIAGLSEKKNNAPTDVTVLQVRFQKLLLNVCVHLKMILSKEKINDAIQEFLDSLPSGYADFIPQSSDLSEIVQALSENEMLDFWNHYLLEYIVDMFGRNDLQLTSMIEQYIKDFQMTEMKHFNLAAKKSYMPGSHHPSVKQSCGGCFQQLSVQVDECMATASSHYIDRLHEMLASRLSLSVYACPIVSYCHQREHASSLVHSRNCSGSCMPKKHCEILTHIHQKSFQW